MTAEPFVAEICRFCVAPDADTRHSRMCPRAGAPANQLQPLVHAILKAYKRLSIEQALKVKTTFTADRAYPMDMTFPVGKPSNASIGAYKHKSILICAAFANSRASVHLLIARNNIVELANELSAQRGGRCTSEVL